MTNCKVDSLRPAILILILLSVVLAPVAGRAQNNCGEIMETALIAGQNIPVGSVTIENDEHNLYVTYQTDGNWLITETHLDVALQPEDLKQTSKGNAVPGRFGYQSEHDPAVTTVTHTIDLTSWPPDSNIYVAAHCVVVSASGSETAWGEGLDFPGNNWAMYIAYALQSCELPPPDPGIIELPQSEIEVQEDAVKITLQLIRTSGSDGQATVTLQSSDITATAGDDYEAVNNVVIFEDGETEKSVEVYILDDLQDEMDELFTVQISSVTGAQMGPNNTTICTIIDDDDATQDPSTISFVEDFFSMNESGDETGNIIHINVVRQGSSDGQASVECFIMEGSATLGIDFNAMPGVLVFEDGETVKSFDIEILDDTESEPDETIALQLMNPVGAQIGSPSSAMVVILDNDELN